MDKELQHRIEIWITRVGHQEAHVRLVRAGASGSTATKIVAGKYPNQPKDLLLKAVEKAMALK